MGLVTTYNYNAILKVKMLADDNATEQHQQKAPNSTQSAKLQLFVTITASFLLMSPCAHVVKMSE